MRRALAAAVLVGVLALPAGASAITYAPVDQPGPRLSVPGSALNSSLQCNGNLAAGPAPVLLVHGTGSNPEHNFGWNWEPGKQATSKAKPKCKRKRNRGHRAAASKRRHCKKRHKRR